MSVLWRETLETLLSQFRASAARSEGLYHIMVEVADDERENMDGPPWFNPHSGEQKIVDGRLVYKSWGCSSSGGMPGIEHTFRAPHDGEEFAEDDRVVRDKSGVVRAVPVLSKLRQSYFCGSPSDKVREFESIANIAAVALTDADDLAEHYFAQDLVDIFRRPQSGVRQVFGEITSVPNQFIAKGWDCGVLQFENGVLIDSPISEMAPDASNWMLLLHRLGWRKSNGTGLTAHRAFWKGHVEIAYNMKDMKFPHHPVGFAKQFGNFSKTSYYSVIGTKDSPIDINLASALAIQLLLADMKSSQVESPKIRTADYSKQHWKQASLPTIKTASKSDSDTIHKPKVGVLVATEVERQAVLKRLRPPRGKRSVLQVFEGSNTFFLGRLGTTDVIVVMTAMGSTGRDSSMIVTSELLELWDLAAVVMVGIAFGKDSKKQMVG